MKRLIILLAIIPNLICSSSSFIKTERQINEYKQERSQHTLKISLSTKLKIDKESNLITYETTSCVKSYDHFISLDDRILQFFSIEKLPKDTKILLEQLKDEILTKSIINKKEDWLFLGLSAKNSLIIVTETSILWIEKGKNIKCLQFKVGLDT